MMKIGASMLGKSVVCPDCRNRIEVPFQSDPRAETLYLRMKQHPPGQASPMPPSSAQSVLPTQQSSPKPQSRPSSPGPSPVPAPAEPSRAAIEQIDDWIEELWADIPDGGIVPESRRSRSPLRGEAADTATGPPPSGNSVSIRTLWGDPAARKLAVTLFAIVFVIGVGSGIVLRSLVVPGRSTGKDSAASANVVAVNGKLSFETPDDKLMSDADAVVIFLPIGNIPIVPFNGRGLRPQDGSEPVEDEPIEVVQQIEELGGRCIRADADGKFSFSVDAAGRYLGILISSHSIRPAETKWNAETDRNLRRFFREPAELVGNYRFLCEEYDLRKGETLSVQHNFSR